MKKIKNKQLRLRYNFYYSYKNPLDINGKKVIKITEGLFAPYKYRRSKKELLKFYIEING